LQARHSEAAHPRRHLLQEQQVQQDLRGSFQELFKETVSRAFLTYFIFKHITLLHADLRINILGRTQGDMSSLKDSSQRDGFGLLLVSGHWPDALGNQFRGKYAQWEGTLAVRLAGIDMLPWVLSIMFLLTCRSLHIANLKRCLRSTVEQNAI
jgi:hypothetical protein